MLVAGGLGSGDAGPPSRTGSVCAAGRPVTWRWPSRGCMLRAHSAVIVKAARRLLEVEQPVRRAHLLVIGFPPHVSACTTTWSASTTRALTSLRGRPRHRGLDARPNSSTPCCIPCLHWVSAIASARLPSMTVTRSPSAICEPSEQGAGKAG